MIQEFSIFEKFQNYLNIYDVLMLSKIYPNLIQPNSLLLMHQLMSQIEKGDLLHLVNTIWPYVPIVISIDILKILVQNFLFSFNKLEFLLKKSKINNTQTFELFDTILKYKLNISYVKRFSLIIKIFSISVQQVQNYFIRYDIKYLSKWQELKELCNFVERLRTDHNIDFVHMTDHIIPKPRDLKSYWHYYYYKYRLLIFGEKISTIERNEQEFRKSISCCIA